MSDSPDWRPEDLSAETELATEHAIGDGAASRRTTALSLPPIEELLIKVGGAAMVLSGLLSWVISNYDAIPNFAGVGMSTSGNGLVVFLAGLYVLLRPINTGITLGSSVGSFTVALIFIVRVKTAGNSDVLGFGVWLALAGAVIVFAGTLALLIEQDKHVDHDVELLAGTSGSILAVVGSTLLAWTYYTTFDFAHVENVRSGLNSEVITGIPVLTLGVLALICQLMLIAKVFERGAISYILQKLIHMSGISIVMLAGSRLAGVIMWNSFSGIRGWMLYAGPVCVLIGGLVLISSIRKIEST